MACSRGSTCSPVLISSACSFSLIRLLRFFLQFSPSPRFLSNLHAFIFGLKAVYTFACIAYQTQGLCNAFACHVLLCALRLTSIGFVHCFSLGSLNCEFVRLCVSFRYSYFASQTSGLCSACTSVPFGILHACVFMFCVLRLAYTGFAKCFSHKFVRLCLSYYVMRTSPNKHRVCAVLFPRFPCEFVCLCVSFRYAYFAS